MSSMKKIVWVSLIVFTLGVGVKPVLAHEELANARREAGTTHGGTTGKLKTSSTWEPDGSVHMGAGTVVAKPNDAAHGQFEMEGQVTKQDIEHQGNKFGNRNS